MPGTMTLDALKEAVARGEIDTVLVAAIDMQGRLMGKRFHAAFFVNGGWKETHCCNYLLAVDMEMNTVPGYKTAGWEKGYGDYVMKPDLGTLRPLPWLPGTALCLADLLDHHTHEEVEVSPRAILKKQVARARAMGFDAMMATELVPTLPALAVLIWPSAMSPAASFMPRTEAARICFKGMFRVMVKTMPMRITTRRLVRV